MNVNGQNIRANNGLRIIIGPEQPSDDTPSVTPLRACQLPQRGSRGRAAPFTRPPGNRNIAGDFHRPYETQKSLHFTIQRTTLPQLRIRSAAPSEREPGMSCAIHPTTWKPQHCGRFSSPLRNSKKFTFSHSTDYTLSELVTMLQGQQFRLPGNSTGVSGQISICTDDPVAWDDNGYGIVTNSTAHRLGRNLRH